MIKIGKFKIKQYLYGYELYVPNVGYGIVDGKRVRGESEKVFYYHTLGGALNGLIDRAVGKSDLDAKIQAEDLCVALAEVEERIWNCFKDVNIDCQWQEDKNDPAAYDTGCSNRHVFLADGPEENGYKRCPYCGGEIEVVGAVEKRGQGGCLTTLTNSLICFLGGGSTGGWL